MSSQTITDRSALARYIASNAESMIVDLFHKNLVLAQKAAHDYVTELDKAIETMAVKTIAQAFPDDGFLGEEGDRIPSSSGYKWIVDPIDGTNNFVRGLPLCGFQLALAFNDTVVEAIITRPFTQEIFTATMGGGAYYVNGLTGEKSAIRVSERSLSDAMVIYDSSVGRPGIDSTHILTALADKTAATRVLGVAVYDIPAVAAGVAEVLVTGISKPYDIAPGLLILKEAGGMAYNLIGAEATMDDTTVIFSNAAVKADILHALQEVPHA